LTAVIVARGIRDFACAGHHHSLKTGHAANYLRRTLLAAAREKLAYACRESSEKMLRKLLSKLYFLLTFDNFHLDVVSVSRIQRKKSNSRTVLNKQEQMCESDIENKNLRAKIYT